MQWPTSLRHLTQLLEVQRDGDSSEHSYVTKDNRPLPASRRTYGPWSFVGLWMVTGSFNVGGWTTGSAILSLGLNVWQAMLAIVVGYIVSAIACVLMGHPGAKWHVAWPQWVRQIWGHNGYFVPMTIRVFLSFVWTATNTWYGGQCLKVFLTCLWPSYASLDTELAGGTMQVSDFVAFFLFVLTCLPLMWFSPERFQKPFLVAATIVATTVFVLLIWSTVRAGGGGALLRDTSRATGVDPAKGGELGWAFVFAVTATIGGIATHMFSQSDYTRYARKPGDQIFAQLAMVPLGAVVVACIGIVCTSCAYTMYPQLEELPWSPYIFLETVRKGENTSSARAGVAFASLAFIISQYGIVVASNAVVAGIDLAAVFPRWFTLRRGAYFTVMFAFIMQPWQLLNGATNFLTVVGSFNIFLGPFMGIQFVDYFLLRKRTMKISAVYNESSSSLYWYTKGLNWRAAVAWPLGFWFLLPGLAQRAMAEGAIPLGWTRVYGISWFLGFTVSGLIYFSLDFIWPMSEKRAVDAEDFFPEPQSSVVDGVESLTSEPSEKRGGSVTEQQVNLEV